MQDGPKAMYSNNIQNFQESTTILNARTVVDWCIVLVEMPLTQFE